MVQRDDYIYITVVFKQCAEACLCDGRTDWTTPFLRSPSSYPLQTGSTTLNLTPAHFSSVPLLHCATSLNILLLLSLLIKCNTRKTGGVHLSKYAASD